MSNDGWIEDKVDRKTKLMLRHHAPNTKKNIKEEEKHRKQATADTWSINCLNLVTIKKHLTNSKFYKQNGTSNLTTMTSIVIKL